MSYYDEYQENPSSYQIYIYSIRSTTKRLGYRFGYKTMYSILRKLNILDEFNLPLEIYVQQSLLTEERVKLPNGMSHPMTYVVGKEGLDFIKSKVDEYLLPPDIEGKIAMVDPEFILIDDLNI
ncbi:hypothetical protein D1614_09545 [Maribellus luteus]|uniref:Uncharacterized protein n=1 Tax=Maribellus luteus TaxID=2305463 RepID=A0A399T1T1_9BACT|nr:hypothetical protein [Maribellus luteus]RIJ48762.1 hypothetical protein D1614_09545 [Maribellus luteus]